MISETFRWWLGGGDVYLIRRRGAELRLALAERAGFVVAVEVVFTGALFVAAHLRSYIPEIEATEKPMEFMLLNAASRSRYYSPDDAWFAGASVSYYYFGYVIQAMVAKLAVVKTSVAFNLGLASTAALALTAAFGLGYELARLVRTVSQRGALLVGAGAIVLVGGIGNLEGVVEFATANGAVNATFLDGLDIANLDKARESGACLPPDPVCINYPNEESSTWWWWRATRISPAGDSITEFPFFSFLLGDLHPHVMAIPYVLTAMAAGLALWDTEGPLGGLAYWRGAGGVARWNRGGPLGGLAYWRVRLGLLAVLLGGLTYWRDKPGLLALLAVL